MMKLNKIVCGVLGTMALASCGEQMDYNEYNIYDKDYVTLNFSNVGGFMTDIYNSVDYDFGQGYGGAILGSASDESEYAVKGNSIEDFYNGAWSPSNAKSGMWTSMYSAIATCNLVIDEFQGLKFDELVLNSDYDQQLYRYQNYKWECRFWRAYFYFNLVRQYGAVPLVTKRENAEITNSRPRVSSDSIFQYIFAECDVVKDSIIKDYSNLGAMALPTEQETGRANNLAVLALRARAALYWASPLFNPSNDKERYHKAALYTNELIEACEARGMKLAGSYESLWSKDNWTDPKITCEIIFGRRFYGSGKDGASNTFEGYNYPVGIEGGKGGNCPTQNLVDAYEMKATGLRPDAAGSGYDAANPYKGRDPRFDATIAKNGDLWPSTNKTGLQTYYGGLNAEPLLGGTPTGYYIKKLCHPAIDLSAKSKYTVDNHTWITYRLGEFYLNMAEALYRYLGSATATTDEFKHPANYYVNLVRSRSGMPDFPASLSNADFWDKYKNERMVELAFEGHRFWDVRRWKEADKYFKSIVEMKLTKNSDGTISYTRNTVNRLWDDKMYFFPIPQTEILKNTNLIQNANW